MVHRPQPLAPERIALQPAIFLVQRQTGFKSGVVDMHSNRLFQRHHTESKILFGAVHAGAVWQPVLAVIRRRRLRPEVDYRVRQVFPDGRGDFPHTGGRVRDIVDRVQ
jgi:hypothetical protein